MNRILVPRNKAKTLAVVAFLVSIAILSFSGNWWPGIMLAVGIPLALRQFLLGHKYDVLITLIVFGGGFFSVHQNIIFPILLPVLFTLGGLYIFARDFFDESSLSQVEIEEDINEEIEDKQKKK